MQELRQKLEAVAPEILPFWLRFAIDEERGGFRGQFANDLTIDPRAGKGVILNARILWTFAKTYNFYHDPVFLDTARRAYEYLVSFSSGMLSQAAFIGWLILKAIRLTIRSVSTAKAFIVYALGRVFPCHRRRGDSGCAPLALSRKD